MLLAVTVVTMTRAMVKRIAKARQSPRSRGVIRSMVADRAPRFGYTPADQARGAAAAQNPVVPCGVPTPVGPSQPFCALQREAMLHVPFEPDTGSLRPDLL